MRTPHGFVSYSLRREASALVLEVDGDAPPGGFAFPWPLRTPPGAAAFDGAPLRFDWSCSFNEAPICV